LLNAPAPPPAPPSTPPAPSRAKRLKKLNRMLTSSGAQSATARFKRQTWLVIGVLLAAHIMGYAVLSTQIQSRFA
jgi:hypothetical protein